MSDSKGRVCGTCRYCVVTNNSYAGEGECRRRSPERDEDGDRVWPLVDPECDWCGELEEKQEAEPMLDKGWVDLLRAGKEYDAKAKQGDGI